MDIGGYRVEIIGGKHISDPSDTRVMASWTPFSGWGSSSLFGSGWATGTGWGAATSTGTGGDKSYVEMKDGDHYKISLKNGDSTRCHAKITIDGNCVGTWLLEPYARATIERPVDVQKKFTFFKVSSKGGKEAGLVKGNSENGLVVVEFIPEHKKMNFFEATNCCGYSGSTKKSIRGLDSGELGGLGNLGDQEDLGEDEDLSFDDYDSFCRPSGTSDKCALDVSLGHSSRRRGGQSAAFRGFGAERQCSTQSYEAGGTGLKGKSEQNFGVSHEKLNLNHDAKVTINLRLVARKDDEVDYERITPLGLSPRSNPVPLPII